MKKFLKNSIVLCFSIILLNCTSDSNDVSGTESGSVGKGGSLAVFSIKGNYLYTVDDMSLNVFQIADIANPVKVNRVSIGRNIETIYSLDDTMFIGSQNGMYIYDVSNPESPKFLSEAQHFTACDPVVAANGYAYVTLHSNTSCGNNLNTLMVYDVADLKNPKLVHQRNLTYPRGLAIHENYLIICDDELKIFDISNPSEPKLAKAINYKFKDLVIYNETLYAFGEQKVTQFKWTNDDLLTLEPISELIY